MIKDLILLAEAILFNIKVNPYSKIKKKRAKNKVSKLNLILKK
jgi:hypothetical protein